MTHGSQVAAPGPGDDPAELIRRIANADQLAMAEVHRAYGHDLLSLITFLVGDQALAEEVLQDTMFAVWRSAASFRGESSVRTWLIGIARRQARDRLRRHHPQLASDAPLAEMASSAPGPELVALDRADAAQVSKALTMLGTAQREVLAVALGGGLTLAEVAEVLGVPLGTVKSRLAAARTALCRVLGQQEGETR